MKPRTVKRKTKIADAAEKVLQRKREVEKQLEQQTPEGEVGAKLQQEEPKDQVQKEVKTEKELPKRARQITPQSARVKNASTVVRPQSKTAATTADETGLPEELIPKKNNKNVRVTTYIQDDVYQKIRNLRNEGRICSITGFVNSAVKDYLKKYKLM